MRPLKDFFFLKIDKDLNATLPVKGHDGSFLTLDTDFDKLVHATQVGTVEIIPASISPLKRKTDNKGEQYFEGFHNNVQIQIGDKVYFHHFVCDAQNLDKETEFYVANYRDIYCVVRDGKILMLEDWCFVEAIPEPEENYTKTIGGVKIFTKSIPDLIEKEGIVKHISSVVEGSGIEAGDHIMFVKDADYSMMIEGKSYYRIKFNYILAVLS